MVKAEATTAGVVRKRDDKDSGEKIIQETGGAATKKKKTSGKFKKPKAVTPPALITKEKLLNAAVGEEKKQMKPEDAPVYIEPLKVVFEKTYNKIILREFDTTDVRGAAVVVGFSTDDGYTCPIAANYLIEELNLPLIGCIHSESFPTLCVVSEGIPNPATRIYGNRDICVIVSEFRFQDPSIQHSIVKAIFEFCERHRASHCFTLGAVQKEPSKRRSITDSIQLNIASDEADGEEFTLLGGEEEDDDDDDDNSESSKGQPTTKKKKKKTPKSSKELLDLLKSRSSSEEHKDESWHLTNERAAGELLRKLGSRSILELTMPGIVGCFMSEMRFRQTPTVILLGRIDEYLQVGTRAAISLIKRIDQFLSQDKQVIDLTKLEKTAEAFDKKLNTVIDKLAPSTPIGAGNMYL